jgi:hypothetical protein
MIAHNPHGSGRAGFPHPAPTSGDDAHAPQGIGMTDRRQRQPASDEAPHAVPKNMAPWLRRDSTRCQSRPTRNRKIASAGLFMGTP